MKIRFHLGKRFEDGRFLKAVIPVKTGIHKTIENTGFQSQFIPAKAGTGMTFDGVLSPF
jgi:hypothetical protein